ncbi:MAG: T9SS type A sorting domain-containing protein, partial [Bacteroidota bacterium]
SVKSANVTQPSALVTSTAVTSVACNGGSNGVASITASGGAGGYTYLWSNGGTTSAITGLLAGVYTATVTDANSCTNVKSASVIQPSAIATNTAVTNVACNGGSNGVASITASGGVGGYTYLWSNGGTTSAITGLLAGVYTGTVTDANSCTSVKSANVTQPSAIATTTAVTSTSCNGGSNGIASITASGGVGGYTYLWSNGGTTSAITGLVPGVYTATVTDANSCTSVKSANVTQPSAIVTSTAVTSTSCNGGSNGVASVSASGGTGGYTYSWAPSGGTGATASGLAANNYTVTVTDGNSCIKTAFANVTQPSAIATTTAVTNVACNGGTNGVASVSASGGAGGYTYSWAPSGGTAATATGLAANNYTVTVTDANSCTKTAFANVTQPSAIATSTSVTNISCFGGTNGVASVSASGGAGGYTYSWTPSGGTAATASGLAVNNYTVTITDANSCTKTAFATITQPAAALSATTSFTNVSCFGGANGKASVLATGGTSPYNYSWAPSGGTAATATGLTANTYTCTITDNNTCSTTRTVTVSQPATAVSATSSATNVSCFGASNGAASVSATGGTSPYTYAWTPSGGTAATATGLTANTYTCTITDNNTCISTKTVAVTQPASGITATASFTNVSCFGGSNGTANVSPTGGTLPYNYSWAPSGGTAAIATGLTPNTYTCTISDNNTCSITKTVTVGQPAAALSATTSFTNVSCFGGSNGRASVSATGGTSPYTYSWTPTGGTAALATGLTPNTYTCTITDNNSCSLTKTVTVAQPATAVSATSSATNVSCFGGSNGTASVSATGGTSPYTYAWTPSGGTAAIATGLTPNTYTCTITDNNSCSLTQTVTVAQPATAVSATTSFTNVTCFGGSNGAAGVLATGGTSPYTYSWTPAGGSSSTASGLIQGIYTCTITDNNSCTLTKTVSITQPTAIAATISSTNTACVGNSGMATVSGVSGGTGAYTYSWSPTGGTAATASSLGVGIYTCTIQDANICSLTLTTTVNTINGPAISVSSQTNVSCAGGSNGAVQVSVTGGTIPYTYSWTPGTSTTTVAVGLTAGTYSCVVTDNGGCTAIQGINISQPAPLVVSSVITSSVLCNGGVATVSVSATGGTTAYTGTGTFTATAGNQTYTVTDINSCMSTTSITVTEPAVIIASASAQGIYCHGGATTITVTATGGTGPYTGTGTFTATAGNYSYTVTDNHTCPVSTATITLVDPAVIMTTQSFSLCTGQSVTVGTNTYSAAGTYTDMVTTVHGCDSTITTNIIVNGLPTVTVAPTTATVCAGSPVSLMAGGAASYIWSNGGSGSTHTVSPTANTTYTVMGTDINLCQNTATVNITVNSAPSVSATASSTLVCKGQTVTLTGQGAITYTWTGGVTNGTAFTPTNTITYTVTGQGANTCKATAAITVSVNPCTGIESFATASDAIDVFPNPGNGNYTIRFMNTDVKTVWVYDVTGRVVYENINTHDTTLQMNIINEPKGIYFVKIQSGNMVSVKKIINQSTDGRAQQRRG